MARKPNPSKPNASVKSVTQERVARGNTGRPTTQGPAVQPAKAPVPFATPRSTLTMKPGQIASAMAANAKPRKKYGLPAGIDQSTMIMGPDQADIVAKAAAHTIAEQAAAAGKAVDAAPSSAPSSHPISQNVKPPQIDLVQHELPADLNDSRLVLVSEPDSEQAAAFRVLRHHILRCGNPQIIAVSGPKDGCGKTTVALNLAMALAECGRSEVLLVDANLRSPKIASILRFVPPWCFAEQLEHHRTQPFTPWTFVDIKSVGLHVAAINPRNEQKSRLDAPAFSIAMERLSLANYQHIVIDCPSVIGNADVNLIQDATDGVLLTVRAREVTTRDIRNAVDQLTPTKILGTTLFE